MLLPQQILPYSLGLLQVDKKISTTFLSKLVGKSHDFLTRNLKLKYFWKIIFKQLVRLLCLGGNWFIIFDETEIDKSHAKVIMGLDWLYSHLAGHHIFGYQLVVIAITNNFLTIPLAWKFYKRNAKTKIKLAIELLTYALTILPHPTGIIFDSLYSSEEMLKFIGKRGLKFFTQVAKNRTLNNLQVKFHNNGRPYWEKTGVIKGNIRVKVVKFRRKYFITNDLRLTGRQIRRIYKIRWEIEEVFRFCKTELNMEKCQLRDLESQNNNIGVCFYLYCVLQDNAAKTQMTMYQLKEELTRNTTSNGIPYLLTLLI